MTLDSDFVKPDLNTNNQPAQKFTQEKKWIIPVPEIRRRDLYYYNLPISKYLSTTECEIEGLGKMTLFGGYSYLSLHKHPYIEQKVTEAIASLELMKQEPEQVTTLHHNVLYAKFKLKEANIETVPSETAILPIWVGNKWKALEMTKYCLQNGIYLQAVHFPIVPKNKAILRLSINTDHTKAQIDRMVEVVEAAKWEVG